MCCVDLLIKLLQSEIPLVPVCDNHSELGLLRVVETGRRRLLKTP
jgi:hypothetical protein